MGLDYLVLIMDQEHDTLNGSCGCSLRRWQTPPMTKSMLNSVALASFGAEATTERDDRLMRASFPW